MSNNAIKVSENFRKAVIKSTLSIMLFLVTYIILIILGIGMVALCGLIAYALIALKFTLITLMLGIGFIGMGFMIFFFLIKFIFSMPKKMDRSHLLEITEEQQPTLFNLINEIVNEVKTEFPKQIYLSSDVNASVFYDSSFWSMFFPVKKSLQIGLGLMNTISVIELKAILAHEFGHFSQRSMRLGSYVYNVNKVIYNMLYDNESYNSLLTSWSNISSYFKLFSAGAILVIRGIQYLLTRVYKILNLNYLALSREMEFHADAVAANVAGSAPLAGSLLRLGLADESLSFVLNYYNGKIGLSQKTGNFYPQQYFMLNELVKSEDLPVWDGLPQISFDVYKKFSKTKLILDNQWSSHPATEERIMKLADLNLPVKHTYKGIAMDMLADKEMIQEMITARIFESVQYETDPVILGEKDFMDEYFERQKENSYPSFYRGYFDSRNPYTGFASDDFEKAVAIQEIAIEELFDDHSIERLSSLNNAISDRSILENISKGVLEIKTFDYDGKKYSAYDSYEIIRSLDTEIRETEQILDEKDIEIFNFFLNRAVILGTLDVFKMKCLAFKDMTIKLKEHQEAYSNLAGASRFMQTSTSFDQITENMFQVKRLEKPFKEQIRLLLEDNPDEEFVSKDIRARFDEYLSKDWKYFGQNMYFNQEVDAFFTVMSDFFFVTFNTFSKTKKSLLEFQALTAVVNA